jgi:hypothetical protein
MTKYNTCQKEIYFPVSARSMSFDSFGILSYGFIARKEFGDSPVPFTLWIWGKHTMTKYYLQIFFCNSIWFKTKDQNISIPYEYA